jgi:glycogen debranching enzyme
MDDGYAVQTTAAETAEVDGLANLQALKDGDTFLVADSWGDLKGGADGLFDHDTRILSRLVMTVGLARPSRLSSGVSRDNVFFTAHTTNRPLPPMGGRSAPAGVLHIERRRFLWDRRMFERVRMVNHGIEDVLVPLAFDFGADFADIFQAHEVKTLLSQGRVGDGLRMAMSRMRRRTAKVLRDHQRSEDDAFLDSCVQD